MLHRQLPAIALAMLIWSGAAAQPIPQAAPDDGSRITILLRTTLIALNHANLTGNYSVLRDLGTPEFKSKFTPADLATAFSDIRQKKMDISVIAIADPEYKTPIPIKENGTLMIDGRFPTDPVNIIFSAAYQLVDGKWMMAGLSVKTEAVSPTADTTASEAPVEIEPNSDIVTPRAKPVETN